jgi:hypothetical protein
MNGAHTATALVAGSLATYRLTRLITTDTITEPLREKVWENHPPESSKLGYLFTCDHCASVYAGAAVSTLAFVASTAISRRHAGQVPAMLLIGTLALSGAVSLYHDNTGNRA